MIVSNSVKLDAVNEIIGTIGESPIPSLEDVYNIDAINAIRLLDKNNKIEQARGWSWNIEKDVVLNPDVDSKRIYWQDDFLFLKGSSNENYVKRGNYLYDADNKTFEFTGSITVDCVRFVDFEDMPEVMQEYIIAKTSRQFQARYLGDPALAQEAFQAEQEAWARLQEFELDRNRFNFFDNTDVTTMQDR